MKRILALAAAVLVSGSVYGIDLTGTTVTGTLRFDPNPINYFDPVQGYVPLGYANSSSATITIALGGSTFGFQDGSNIDTAYFNGNVLRVTDDVISGASNWTMTFTDTAFTGTAMTPISDNFVNGGVNGSIAGDVITLTWAGIPEGSALYTAVFTVNPASAPDGGSTVALLGLALGAFAMLRRRFCR